jgi:hypothetical protein
MKLIHVEKVKTYLGATDRSYVNGVYMGAVSTRARALQGVKEAFESWDFKTMRRKRPPRSSSSS